MDNKLKIINYLGKHKDEIMTMHQLSNQIRIPYATFYRTIKEMKDLIELKTVGKATTLKLKQDSIIKSYLAISSEEEKKEFLKRKPIINKIASELNTKEIVLLFGSYAKGTERDSSDIDLMIINNGKRTLSFSKYELLFKKRINPIFITKTEFIRMLKEKEENLGKQALKYHILLNNPQDFWELAINAGIQKSI